MDKVFGAAIVIALISTALTLMALSWRRRRRRDLALVMMFPDKARGARVLSVECLYVATTPREQPLERLAIPGLAFRAKATVSIETNGVLIEPAGEHATLIEHARLRGVRSANATIDRSVGVGSLTAIDWQADSGDEITSFFRIPRRIDRTVFEDAVRELLEPSTTSRSTNTKESAQ
ncbi:unannotated protein [freshwater metagenome]|uniref:Unannotated protein n=1 Tax=freshwater metagenome TaxID=449393 RepID=A0A6J6CVT1_9ZZZZ|nr:hypothetical protein [Actinomycetota bacterium]